MSLPTFPSKLPRFKYIGPHGSHIPHTVLSNAKDVIVTWSDPDPNEEFGGWSWLGDTETFRREFEACS